MQMNSGSRGRKKLRENERKRMTKNMKTLFSNKTSLITILSGEEVEELR